MQKKGMDVKIHNELDKESDIKKSDKGYKKKIIFMIFDRTALKNV